MQNVISYGIMISRGMLYINPYDICIMDIYNAINQNAEHTTMHICDTCQAAELF